ncbi:MAG: hypothetical protein EKK63_12630 [Acinetobacter sp.]|nr:MAG: hypothetical protein EKK63_12630 [Acinetobacter sp.]
MFGEMKLRVVSLFKMAHNTVLQKKVEGHYPKYTAVIPSKESCVISVKLDKSELVKTLLQSEYAQNKATHRVVFTLNEKLQQVTIHSEDLDFDLEFTKSLKAEVVIPKPTPIPVKADKPVPVVVDEKAEAKQSGKKSAPAKKAVAKVTEVVPAVIEEKEEEPRTFEIGFNGKFLKAIVQDCEDEVTILMSTPSRAVLINEDFLLMPVMLNN